MSGHFATILRVALFATFAACSSSSYVDDADTEVAKILDDAHRRTLGEREAWVIRPTEEAPKAAESPSPAMPTELVKAAAAEDRAGNAPAPSSSEPVPQPVPPPSDVYDLPRALATAVTQNRGFLARREGLYRDGLSYSLTRFQFGPQFAAAISYLWPHAENGAESHQTSATASASQILPTGGTLALTGGLDASWPFGPGSGDAAYGSNAAISLTQPLLRGFGYEVSHEALTQAERELTYRIRDFEDFREGFSIEVAQRFFALTSQKQTLANEDRNYEAAVFDREKAEALLRVGRYSEIEVFRARRREIDAKDQLINAQAAYDRAIDEFKIFLGLPTQARIALADVEPPYLPVRFEVSSAVQAALHNRLDLITERQRVEDVERGLRIAENSLLPDLSLVASYGVGAQAGDLGEIAPDEWNSSIGLSMAIPLQQKSERNNYRSALIAAEQARRELKLREDQLDLDIRDSVRSLKSLDERIVLQTDQIEHERRALTVTEIRAESSNRDMLEARQALFSAQNALIELKVQHFVARLKLMKDMGLFFVDDRGAWR